MSKFYDKTTSDEVLKNARERVTDGIRGIDTDHAYIHEGRLFSVFTRFTLAASAVGRIVLKSPETKYIHYRKEIVTSSGDKVSIELFEAPTVTDGTGTSLTPVNYNRISTNQSEMVAHLNPTVTNDGALIHQSFIGGGTGAGASRSGEEVSQSNEVVFKRDELYLVKITNGSTAENIIQVNPMWYEEDEA